LKGEVMKSKKCLVLVIMGVCVVLVSCYLVMAGEPSSESKRTLISASTREVLVGLKGVYVLVEEINSEFEKKGLLTRQDIQTLVELELRKFGITVLPNMPARPYLYVNFNYSINPYNSCSGGIIVELHETVMSTRQLNTYIVGATVWSRGSSFQNYEPKDVHEIILKYVDKFINDYLAANPKEQITVKDTNDINNR
jgi:hypothetical protein